MICANCAWTLRVSASTSGESGTTSGNSSTSATRYGSSWLRLDEPDPVQPLDEDPQRPVGHLDHLVDDRGGADVVEILEARHLGLRVPDRDERQHALAGDDVVDQLDRALLPDRERDHRLREDDRFLQRQHRELRADRSGLAHRVSRTRDRDRAARGAAGLRSAA